ncbi:MAG: KH domain-containing protein [Thermomicrobiales bacterium]|nr:KH domain-containing protein [Thermomicrobiales bacterium]
MVEPRDDFENEDFDDVEGADELGFDAQAAIDSFESSEGDITEQLRAMVEWIIIQLVDETDELEVTADQRGSSVRVQVTLPEEDLGKVIGRGGRIAKSIRTILMIVGSREHMRVSLDIEGRN